MRHSRACRSARQPAGMGVVAQLLFVRVLLGVWHKALHGWLELSHAVLSDRLSGQAPLQATLVT